MITGGGGNDILIGGQIINGDGGDDLLISTGVAEAATIIGSSGSDIVIGSDETVESYSYFLPLLQSTPDSPDTILNFQTGQDVFDFGGEQAGLIFVGNDAFTASDGPIEHARFENGRLEVDLDGDQTADLAFNLVGVETFSADDIIAAEPAELWVETVFGNLGPIHSLARTVSEKFIGTRYLPMTAQLTRLTRSRIFSRGKTASSAANWARGSPIWAMKHFLAIRIRFWGSRRVLKMNCLRLTKTGMPWRTRLSSCKGLQP